MAHNRQAPKTFCTTREAAELLSVSLRTAQLWSESGLLEAWKTDGGHRRISRLSIERLLAEPIVRQLDNKAKTPEALKILVVEDDPALRRLYEINMQRWPMSVRFHSANDGYEALIRIGHDKPDLLITDLQMPGMDGFRMLNTLCNISELADMQIVAVSGLDPDAISAHGGIPDGISLLSKPVPFSHLLAIAEKTAQVKLLKAREAA
ncbi:response regulator [Gallionella capsiferriformans]|jgi:excisionase family DNA binding protein|uniref:Response regulator receiver protein n=1 Tax=Gallionella capsiferriformans (strain ES-2) TaxID=395494 RepID=D9SDP0_GALCS|nr:response regulator [Gallionella capsiferriformans]ADL54797.1 response regulator receiver protein [Gallionella capsiferriformans ES-2]